ANNGYGGGGEGDGQGQWSTSNSSSILHDAMAGNARKMTTHTASSALDTALKNAVDTYFQNTEYVNAYIGIIMSNHDIYAVDGVMDEAMVKAMNAKTNSSAELLATKTTDKLTTAGSGIVDEESVGAAYP